MIIVITSGYFNPLHVGHLEYLTKARDLGDKLFVIVNNDAQIGLKGSKPFMHQDDRRRIIEALKCVDAAVLSNSSDISVCSDLDIARIFYPDDELIFAKGGDRFASEIPEAATCERLNIKMIDGLGNKIRASSEILKKWENET